MTSVVVNSNQVSGHLAQTVSDIRYDGNNYGRIALVKFGFPKFKSCFSDWLFSSRRKRQMVSQPGGGSILAVVPLFFSCFFLGWVGHALLQAADGILCLIKGHKSGVIDWFVTPESYRCDAQYFSDFKCIICV